jgi:hypothetical protein
MSVPPAPGALIGHLTGRVIWDTPQTSLLQTAAIRNTSLSARCKRLWVHLPRGLGSRDVGDWDPRLRGTASMRLLLMYGSRERSAVGLRHSVPMPTNRLPGPRHSDVWTRANEPLLEQPSQQLGLLVG